MNTELIESIKEAIRTFSIGEILTVIGVLGIIASGINKELGTFIIQWNVALAFFAFETIVNVKTALGRALDKYIHESGTKTLFDLKGLDTLK